MSQHKILLIVDDDEHVIQTLCRLLKFEPYEIVALNDPLEAIELGNHKNFDVVLSDNRMPGMSGVELMHHFLDIQPACKRISMSAYQDFNYLIDAFNQGYIEHFVQKPWKNDALKALLSRFLAPTRASESGSTFERILSQSESMFRIFERVSALRDLTSPVFIHGETGTGKELIARALHDQSDRAKRDFIAVNCSNLNPEIMESQLFGHRKGAFTGAISDQIGLLAAADGGTLFLDEVTDLPAVAQSKLLRALQEREFVPVGATKPISFDARIISAASTKMQTAVDAGVFRADLMYRLEVIPIDLPPLRERHGDILMLFKHFTGCDKINRETIRVLEAYCWPGNVRELHNASLYARAFANDGPILVDHLPDRVVNGGAQQNSPTSPQFAQIVCGKRHFDANDINEALRLNNYNKSAAARSLGVSRMTLWRHMVRLDLS